MPGNNIILRLTVQMYNIAHTVYMYVHTQNIVILTVWRYSGCAGPGGCVTPSDSMVSSRWATEYEGVESEEGGGRGVVWGMRGEVGTEGDHRPIGRGPIISISTRTCIQHGTVVVINTNSKVYECVCCVLNKYS